MSKKKKKEPTAFAPRIPHSKPVWALIFGILGVLTLVALWYYNPSQAPQLTTRPEPNPVGEWGASYAFWSIRALGLGSWLIPLLLTWLFYAFLFRLAHAFRWWKYIAFFFLIVMSSSILTFAQIQWMEPGSISTRYYTAGLGGLTGRIVYAQMLNQLLGNFGSAVILIFFWLVSAFFTFMPTQSPGVALDWLKARMAEGGSGFKGLCIGVTRFTYNAIKNAWSRFKENRQAAKVRAAERRAEEEAFRIAAEEEIRRQLVLEEVQRAQQQAHEEREKQITTPTPEPNITTPTPTSELEPVAVAVQLEPEPITADVLQTYQPKPSRLLSKPAPTASLPTEAVRVIAGEQIEKAHIKRPERKGDYIFPTLDLLQEPPTVDASKQEDHTARATDLVNTLKQFGIDVTPGEVHTGPVITRYEITPAPGVRVEKIANLDKNIAMALRAVSVRIMAPVPGKGCVGVEIPNQHPQPVCLREIIESKAWAESKSEIPVVLGKEVTGKPIVADLTKMPHLLIAGSTGSGKTVCINAIIASLLYHSSPDDLRFIMVDPKIVEMQLYNSLPHMLIPVVTDPKKVPGALKWLIREMENRYQIFAKMGVRNIAGFNAKILRDRKEKAKADELDASLSPEERAAVHTLEVPRDQEIEIPKEKLPYIVCVIDELADLMMVAPADIETGIARLAQLARAAGIHLIIATQRPSVNVITGVIKANLPSRIAFKVASKVDSRTILDGGGADTLIGRGDMLFTPPGSFSMVRAQGAFVSDDEINGIIDFLKQNGPPQLAHEVQQQIEAGGPDAADKTGESEWGDELVPNAIEILRTSKRASTSMLQRRLKIGYNRAARIMEILEAEGIVGPENGSSPREILMELQ